MDAKSIINEIEQNLTAGIDSNLEIEEPSLLQTILDANRQDESDATGSGEEPDKKREKGSVHVLSRTIALLSVLFLTLVFFIIMLVTIIREVVFFSPESSVNDFGAVVMKQPCGREEYIFLYNTSKCWDNTGIEVMKGDIIEVHASGSFYGKISDINNAANNNLVPEYWIEEKKKKNTAIVNTLCIFKGKKWSKNEPRFGSLLLQIQPDDTRREDFFNNENNIVQTNKKLQRKFTANKNGRIYVTVNDIYLQKEIIDTIAKRRDLFEKYVSSHNTFEINAFKKKAGRRPEMWFDDNVGEMLLSITVTRKIFFPQTHPLKNLPKTIVFFCYRYTPYILCTIVLFFLCNKMYRKKKNNYVA